MVAKAYDVVIAGGGPGGLVAARSAALKGARTLVVEKKRQLGFPEHDFVAIFYSVSDAENMIGFPIERSCFSSKSDEIVYFSPSGKRGKGLRLNDALWVNRHSLERYLAREAVEAGVEMVVNTSVIDLVKKNGQVTGVVVRNGHETQTVESKVVIGASGPFATIPLMAGLQPPKGQGVALALDFVGVKSLHPQPRSYEIYTGAYHGGLWAQGGLVSPHTDDRVVVGVAWILGQGKKPGRMSHILQGFIKRLEEIGKYKFDKASPVSMVTGIGAGGWHEDRHHRIVADGFMLIGDAAGKPLVGCKLGAPGITNAMVTGRYAGEAAASGIKKGDVTEKYLTREYLDKVHATSDAARPGIMEARKCVIQLGALGLDKVEKAISEIGEELVALRLYERGALTLSGCLKPVQDWLRKESE